MGLLYVALWAANVQSIAVEHGRQAGHAIGILDVLLAGPVFDVRPDLYSSQMTVIACASTLTIGGLMCYWLHRAYWMTRSDGPKPERRSPWLLPYLPLPALIVVLVVAQASFVFYRTVPVILTVLGIAVLFRTLRGLGPR